jgi:MoaA/NifB/PqqE/SkfB family radical SAM enzyme
MIFTQDSFNKWLDNKKPDEYWNGELIDNNYSSIKENLYRNNLIDKKLTADYITWFTTNRCNLFCDHCGQSSGKAKDHELTKTEFLSLIPSFNAIGVRYISLSGGEPLLREDIFEIIHELNNQGFTVGIISNGFKVPDLIIDKLRVSGIKSLNLSLDGMAFNHDIIRKVSGSFDDTVAFIKKISDHDYKKTIVTCVYPQNLDDLEEMKHLIKKLNIKTWLLRTVASTGRATQYPYLKMKDSDYEIFFDFVLRSLKEGVDIVLSDEICYLGELDSVLRPSPYYPSTAWDSFHLCSNGDVKAISEDYVPIEANVREKFLEDIWYNEFKTFRNFQPTSYCLACNYYGKCAGEYIPNLYFDQKCLVANGILK